MAITPKELEKHIVADEAKLTELESIVDNILIEATKQGKEYPLRVNYGKLGSGLYEKTMLKRYRAKGWTVEEKADHSSDSYGSEYWYEFTPKNHKRG